MFLQKTDWYTHELTQLLKEAKRSTSGDVGDAANYSRRIAGTTAKATPTKATFTILQPIIVHRTSVEVARGVGVVDTLSWALAVHTNEPVIFCPQMYLAFRNPI